MGIRLKILSGFLILVFMLIIAGVWSIYELQSMGTSLKNCWMKIIKASMRPV